MVSAWSMGKGKRSTDYFLNTQSPGPAAYAPEPKSKSPVPHWSMAVSLRGSIYESRNTPGPGAYVVPSKVRFSGIVV